MNLPYWGQVEPSRYSHISFLFLNLFNNSFASASVDTDFLPSSEFDVDAAGGFPVPFICTFDDIFRSPLLFFDFPLINIQTMHFGIECLNYFLYMDLIYLCSYLPNDPS